MNEQPLNLELADHLFVDCQGYSHHGIYIGNERVVHFESTPVRKFLGQVSGQPPRIQESNLTEFSGDKIIHVRRYTEMVLSPDKTVAMAHSRIGEEGYHLFDNNCEHFAVWCKTGNESSTQVESAQRIVSTGAAGVVMGSAIIRSARFLPVPLRLLAYSAGAAIAIGSTTYRVIKEKQFNRENSLS